MLPPSQIIGGLAPLAPLPTPMYFVMFTKRGQPLRLPVSSVVDALPKIYPTRKEFAH